MFPFSPVRVWSVPAGNATLSVSFCSPLPKCNGASICRIGPDGTDKISLGKKDSSIMSAIAQDHSGFSVIYNNGDQCIVDKTKNHKSEVYFICGKTLVCSSNDYFGFKSLQQSYLFFVLLTAYVSLLGEP